jgi:hypothetical protein
MVSAWTVSLFTPKISHLVPTIRCSTDFIASDFKIDDAENTVFILRIFTLTKIFITYELLFTNCPVLRIPNFKGGRIFRTASASN